MSVRPLIGRYSMTDKDDERADQPAAANTSPGFRNAGMSGNGKDESPDLASEALAHMQIYCEQLRTHVKAFVNGVDACELQQIVDDLFRMRNTFVILEKPASEYVVSELLTLLDTWHGDRPVITDDQAKALDSAVAALDGHLGLMRDDMNKDDALDLVPLVNDCRACRAETLISDVLMLAAGIQGQKVHNVAETESSWLEQRQLWLDHVTAQHSVFAEQMSCWQGEVGADSAVLLVSELDRLALFSAQYEHLASMQPLFQSASLLVRAVSREQLKYGAAIKSLLAQLVTTVNAGTLAETPADLVPGDLLRNCLYYVAQIDSESTLALTLRRRFRLDRVRQVANASRRYSTPTIGVLYHLTNAVRIGVARESASLRAWLDAAQNMNELPPATARLRVRLQQIHPVLTLLGAKEAVECLHANIAELQDLPRGHIVSDPQRSKLAAELMRLDTLLDQSARKSVMRKQGATVASDNAVETYTDIAVDTCLREARDELQSFMDSLLRTIQSSLIEESAIIRLSSQLDMINGALQVLPLPELRPVFVSLKQFLVQQQCHDAASDNADFDDATLSMPLVSGKMVDMLVNLHISLDDYLGCVMQPQTDARQFLIDAEETLEHLLSGVSSTGAADNKGTVTDAESGSVLSSERNMLSLSDVGSLTLDVEEDLLLDAVAEPDSLQTDSSQISLVYDECFDHLDSLAQCVKRALTPSANLDARLPNEQMLRALHNLTGNSQMMGFADITAVSQPLQRAALALQRKGTYFGVKETLFVGKLVEALRLRLESVQSGVSVDSALIDLKNELSGVLQNALSGVEDVAEQIGEEGVPFFNIGEPIRPLNNVFHEEVTELLDQLRGVIRSKAFDSDSVIAALALVHTLKGSAHLTGSSSMSDCAHAIEAEVISVSSIDARLKALKDGYQSLQDHLLQFSLGLMAEQKNGQNAPSSIPSAAGDSSDTPVDNDGHGYTGSHSDNSDDEDSVVESALDLAFDLSFKQAGLGDELDNVRSIGRDIQVSLMRYQSELRGQSRSSARVDEIIADLENSSNALRVTLGRADKTHRQASRANAMLQHALIRDQLVRFDTLHQRLTESIEDVANSCDKEVRLQLTGGELMVDKVLFRQLGVLLEQLVRNAVVHGIEPPAQRRSTGKSSVGTISLHARTDGCELIIALADDGRGIDIDDVNALLDERGKPRVANDAELQELLLSSGYSSTRDADVFAGHGLGLSAVQTVMKHVHGSVELQNRTHQGLSVMLRIPQPLVVCRSVLVREGKRLYGIPVSLVKSVHFASDNIDATPGADQADRNTIRLSYLFASLLFADKKPILTTQRRRPSLQIDYHGDVVNIAVDKLIGYRELVVHPLGAQISSLGQFSAGGVYSNGEQVLIVDLPGLLNAGWSSDDDASRSAVRNARRPFVPSE